MNINLASNLVARIITAVIAFLSVPVYISYVGVESYAIITFLATIQAICILLDSGFSAGYLRQVAIYTSDIKKYSDELNDLTLVIACGFAIVSFAIFFIIYGLADYLSNDWLNFTSDIKLIAEKSFKLIAFIVATRFYLLFLSASLKGKQKFLQLNIAQVCCAVLKFILAVVLLEKYSDDATSICLAFGIANTLEIVLISYLAFNKISLANVDFKNGVFELKKISGFIGIMALVSLTSAFLSQSDKVILSKFLPAEEYAIYAMAGLLASIPITLSSPLAGAIYPKLVELYHKKSETIGLDYHYYCKLISIVIFPVSTCLFLYADYIFYYWTGLTENIELFTSLARILIIGSTILSIMSMPYFLCLTIGKPSISLITNTVALGLILLFMPILISMYGAIGGSLVWLLVNLCFLIVFVNILHKHIFSKELREWYIADNFKYMLISLSVGAPFKYVLLGYFQSFSLYGILIIAICGFCMFSLCYFLSPVRIFKR